MKNKKSEGFFKFVIFFLLIAFVVSCSFFLFFTYMDFNREQLWTAAPITFGNVIFMTLIFWGLDTIRKKIYTDRPIRRITEGLEQITKGDFKTEIAPIAGISGMAEYNEIIAYINQMTRELSGVETLRTDFVSNVSHEMKTPLAVIRNYAQMLETADITESERIEYAKAIDDASKGLSELVTNILKLNKLENQQIYPSKIHYDLSEQVCECLLDFESEWEAKNIELATNLADEIFIDADPELMSLVWHNLFSNAMKFTPEGGSVTVGVYVESNRAVVSVSDSGCGMDENTIKHIFEKFYQGDTSHAVRGNGLGLALVKRVLDITGAEINVESRVGEGSTFKVCF